MGLSKSIKKRYRIVLAIFTIVVLSCLYVTKVGAVGLSNQVATLDDDELLIYGLNSIIFPDNDCINTGGSSSICGDNAKEMYWSALSQYIDDPIKRAGVMGNLSAEGAFQPVLWELEYTNSDGTLAASWDKLYNCGGGSCPFGVGAFGFTYRLGEYLQAVNAENPDLLKYFQNSSEYSINDADGMMEKIGRDDFARLVEFEVKYAIETWESETTQEYLSQNFSNPSDAAYWWMDKWERPGVRTESARRSAAEKAYDEYKDFSCTPSKSSSTPSGASTTGSNLDVTLIGDSIAVQAEAELQSKFPGAFMSKVGSRHSDSKGKCDNDEGGIDILRKIASGSGEVADQHAGTESCYSLNVDKDSLKDNVVWELGTNPNGASEETIKNVINRIGQRKLFLVTPYNGDDMALADSISELYRKVAKENDAVYVVDWNEAVRGNASDYITTDDGMAVHPTEKGRQLLADLIEETVSNANNCSDNVVLDAVAEVIELANKNGSTYVFGGGHSSDASLYEGYLNGDSIDVDCTGFSTLVLYKAFGVVASHDSAGLVSGEESGLFEEVPRSEVRPGDVFAFRYPSGGSGHGGIVIEAANGVVTKVAEAVGAGMAEEGRSGNNYNIGYSTSGSTIDNLNSDAGHFYRLKGVDYDQSDSCLERCKDTGGFSDGGLTEEEAQMLADYYNSDKVSADEWGLPFGKTNCVSFSMWFVQALTSIGKNGDISDNGNGVAHLTALVGNLEEGNDARPYSVWSVTEGITMCGNVPCGHTGIIVGVNGDDIITVEAAYPSTPAEVHHRTSDFFENTRFGKSITYLESILNKSELNSITRR